MGKTYAALDDGIADFIRRQHVFFVATAPLAADGHVNVSPKGLATFAVVDPCTVAYADLTGSGIETVAHLRENGRITLCFCAFEGPPRILRLYGAGSVLEPGTPEFDALGQRFGEFPSLRAIVRVALDRIADSCGYGVPLYRFEGDRGQLHDWVARKGPAGIARYQDENNRVSLDGLRGLVRRRD
jgi:Pyridoxamine 5'-phosphate oxidase